MKEKQTPLTPAEKMARLRKGREGKYRRIELWLPLHVAVHVEELAHSNGCSLGAVLGSVIREHLPDSSELLRSVNEVPHDGHH